MKFVKYTLDLLAQEERELYLCRYQIIKPTSHFYTKIRCNLNGSFKAVQKGVSGFCYSEVRLHLRSISIASLVVKLLQTRNEEGLFQRSEKAGPLKFRKYFILEVNKDM